MDFTIRVPLGGGDAIKGNPAGNAAPSINSRLSTEPVDDGSAAFTSRVINEKFVNSEARPSGLTLVKVSFLFSDTAGYFFKFSALTNSHGATGFACCHNPRCSLRAACSDC